LIGRLRRAAARFMCAAGGRRSALRALRCLMSKIIPMADAAGPGRGDRATRWSLRPNRSPFHRRGRTRRRPSRGRPRPPTMPVTATTLRCPSATSRIRGR